MSAQGGHIEQVYVSDKSALALEAMADQLATNVPTLRDLAVEQFAAGVPVPAWVAAFLNRRTEVEIALRDVAAGKRGPIEPDEARRLANLLTVPAEFGSRA